ncbi:Phosphate ABC transporter substrate-binding protein, PhoT family [Candidatus Nitrospira nitrosa]|uniref:Phosphate ABC transporter substrate-binding protein, PhoT family n=1 Tax=Candidatus Nitrospira nitrosa TaxID=1742972 RepID=A0A0S4L2Y8_9BACT|nr:phosphate ABC transporter substrate-binding protein [Candidatus Nitrospira nitrosa]CUS32035.1 Phosphate ABC transporter substrate-binding protein, PhoT family [Candidatus Nitrospira nitrosa]
MYKLLQIFPQKTLGSFVAFLCVSYLGIGGSATAQANQDQLSGKLVITGASTLAPLITEIGKRFESLYPNVRVDVQTGGSSRGVADARQGLADIGMVSRAMKDEEKDLYAFPVARDGVGIILHKDNPIRTLTDEQVVAIYTGKIINWKDVGGKDAPIAVVNKAEGRSTLEVFLHYFRLKNTDIKAQVVIGDNEQGVKTVAGNRNAIGYVSIGTAEYDESQGVPIKLLPTGGVAASTETVRNRTFPMSRPLHIVTRTPPVGLAKTFIDYAQSRAVHDIITQQSFVPLAD